VNQKKKDITHDGSKNVSKERTWRHSWETRQGLIKRRREKKRLTWMHQEISGQGRAEELTTSTSGDKAGGNKLPGKSGSFQEDHLWAEDKTLGGLCFKILIEAGKNTIG